MFYDIRYSFFTSFLGCSSSSLHYFVSVAYKQLISFAIYFIVQFALDLIVRSELTLFDKIAQSWFFCFEPVSSRADHTPSLSSSGPFGTDTVTSSFHFFSFDSKYTVFFHDSLVVDLGYSSNTSGRSTGRGRRDINTEGVCSDGSERDLAGLAPPLRGRAVIPHSHLPAGIVATMRRVVNYHSSWLLSVLGFDPMSLRGLVCSFVALFSGNPGSTAGRGFNPAGGAPGGG
ncbi:hypothetical protein F511_09108 [Dorcoceras hygrometricum]|uniref:Uncharacterized protein n=1 Tax=Dorcoceras hygrometricum TaxID=472368 RepID=A0A2Z7AJW0_9LAMI|nr:hypothetical protein F511_09108 [Dorcoceras hygrometricum]